MSSLPEEIYLEILLTVPVKFTSVCKCVCKSWFCLISDHSFGKLHLRVTTQRNSCSVMFKSLYDVNVHSISYDSLLSSNESDDSVVTMDFPYSSSRYLIFLWGHVMAWYMAGIIR